MNWFFKRRRTASSTPANKAVDNVVSSHSLRLILPFLNTNRNGKVFLVFAGRNHRELIFFPDGFNLDTHLSEFPPMEHGFPSNKKFNKNSALWFLKLLHSVGARNQDLIEEDGYVPIHTKTIRDHIKEIKDYINYFERTELIEINKGYVVKHKSRRYKWHSKYDDVDFSAQSVPCTWADDVFKYQEESNDPKKHPYLFHWYQQDKLAVKYNLAIQYATMERDEKLRLGISSWDINRDKGGHKHPRIQYLSILDNVAKIHHHQTEPHIDEAVHRMHTVLTNLKKGYRNFLTYDGKSLKAIDIKNCQPYLATLLFNPEFWEENSKLPININNIYEDTRRKYIPKQLPIMIGNFLEVTPQEAFQPFIEIASSGRMYETLMEQLNLHLGEDEKITRDDAKTLMFNILFSKNNRWHRDQLIVKAKQIFTQLYPEVMRFFTLIKNNIPDDDLEKQHSRLACLLQSIESKIILHHCCKRIWEEGEGLIPIFTIHDSIATTEEYVDYVEKVMREELTACIGKEPPLSKEEWGLSNDGIDQSILQSIISSTQP